MSRINWQVTIQKLCSAWVGWPDRPCYSSGTHSASLCLRGNMRPEGRAPPTGNMAARIAQWFKELGEKGSMWTIRMVGNSSTKGLESPSHCASSSDLKRIYCHSKTGWPEGIPSGQFSLSPTPHSLLQKANAHFPMGLPQRLLPLEGAGNLPVVCHGGNPGLEFECSMVVCAPESAL